MPGTEDIAEKVADLLVDNLSKAGAAAVQAAPKVAQGVGAFGAITIGQVIQEIQKNNALKQLMGLEGEVSVPEMSEIVRKFSQRSSTLMVGDSDVKDFEALLKEQGVLYAKVDRQDDNCKMYIFLNRDNDKVLKASKILQANRGVVSELNPDLYFNSLSPEKVQVLQGITPAEMELFRHYARQEGILFSAVARKDDYMVLCNAEDEQKTRRALLYTGWALTGANGERVREQIEHRIAGRTAIQISAEEGDRELYVVSSANPGNYLWISAEGLAQHKQGKEISRISRHDPDFQAKCMALSDNMAHPVVLSAAQFRSGLTPKDLETAKTIDLFPEYYDDMIQMDEVNRLANLVARKSGLDDEHNATWGLWDPSVSYSEFAGLEYIADEDERDARAFEFEHFKQAAYYSHDRHDIQVVDMEEKDLDYIIAKAEQKRRAMERDASRRPQERSFWENSPVLGGLGNSGPDEGRE